MRFILLLFDSFGFGTSLASAGQTGVQTTNEEVEKSQNGEAKAQWDIGGSDPTPEAESIEKRFTQSPRNIKLLANAYS